MQAGKGISIPSILKVGKGALARIGSYLKKEGIEQVVIFFGNGLIDLFGTDVMASLKQEEIRVLEYSELDTVDIDDIITLAFAMPNKTQEERSSMPESMQLFYGIFHLSVYRLQVQVMDFPVQAHHFLSMESGLPFRQGLLMALSWIHRSYGLHRRSLFIPGSVICSQRSQLFMTGSMRKSVVTVR